MIELPEAKTIAKDLRNAILGKTIVRVGGNFTDHKFTFYHEDPQAYNQQLSNKKVTKINDRNFYVEIEVEDYILLFRDGANIRYFNDQKDLPEKSKLLIIFDDGSCINVTTSMYCFIGAHKKGNINNKYYDLEIQGVGALDESFSLNYFKGLLDEKTLKLSIKGFLATEQRILGIGNGVVQDIMFNAKLHPKRKMMTLSEDELENLYQQVKKTLSLMVEQNGRDTEKDIYGQFGNYSTILSNKTYKNGCPLCSSEIKKESFLGGSIYYCTNCQKLK